MYENPIEIFKTESEAEIFTRGMPGYRVVPFTNDDGWRRYRVEYTNKTLREGGLFT